MDEPLATLLMDTDSAYSEDPGPSAERRAKLFALLYSADEVENRTNRIYNAILTQSPHIKAGNFEVIGTDDLERLFLGYDREFFRGRLAEMLMEDGAYPMYFRLSRRLTRAAGQTAREVRRVMQHGQPRQKINYEISISTTLLYSTFQHVDRPVTVGGLVCRDRLQALQRIFEHEILHLAEFLGWGKSNCRADNFHALSRRIFAHEGAYHDLVSPREQAAVAHGIKIGDMVTFETDGTRYRGRVNRITRRASVLVQDPHGVDFSDGNRYRTFYVPLTQLKKL